MKKLKFILSVAVVALTVLSGGLYESTQAADVSGEWKITITFLFGEGQHTALMKQSGNELSGIYKGEFKEGMLRGEIKGNTIDFTGHLRHEASSMNYHYTGTLDGKSMSGTVEMGEYWSAQWKAEKVQ